MDTLLDSALDRRIGLMLGSRDVSPDAKRKLKGLLKHYAKKPRPFTACVRDNRERFGQKGAERVCATLKDIIRGTTKWRGGGKTDRGAKGLRGLSEPVGVYLGPLDTRMPVIDDAVLDLIEQMTDAEIEALVSEVREEVLVSG